MKTTIQSPINYIKTVGLLTLLSGILAFACNILIGLAVNFNFDALADPTLIFKGLHNPQIQFFRWSMITDIWGYYLLFVPAVFYLYEKMETPWRHVFVASGIAYSFMGAIGAAILAATGTHFLQEYLNVEPALQTEAKSNFLLVFHVVNNGIWNLLEMGLFGIFMFGTAPVLRPKDKLLYYLTILLGISGILDAAGNTFEMPILAETWLNFYLLLTPIWAIWLGLLWMRSRG
ncbi:MAG: hypothetical protein H6577_05390 [Lewinellaceae bacterium]|nr:hypothetical protein [Saprospiraceae bacterium]MCB9337538.1 hypothetical protein [Lewinellaceae bacterium]